MLERKRKTLQQRKRTNAELQKRVNNRIPIEQQAQLDTIRTKGVGSVPERHFTGITNPTHHESHLRCRCPNPKCIEVVCAADKFCKQCATPLGADSSAPLVLD